MVYCDKEHIAKIIKNYRRKACMTQFEFAERIGISEKHLSKIETGKNFPALDNFLKMVELLNIPLYEFGLNINENDSEKKINLLKIINTLPEKNLDAYEDIMKTLSKWI